MVEKELITHVHFACFVCFATLSGMMVGGSSDVGATLGKFLSDAHLPVIGYDTTLNEVTTRDSYSYFARVLPSDKTFSGYGE